MIAGDGRPVMQLFQKRRVQCKMRLFLSFNYFWKSDLFLGYSFLCSKVYIYMRRAVLRRENASHLFVILYSISFTRQ